MKEKKNEKIAPDPLEDIVCLPVEWPYRLMGTAFILAVILVLASMTVTVKRSLVSKQIESWVEDFYDFTLGHGFALDDILVSGHKKTTKDEIVSVLGLSRNDNILKIDVNEVKQKLETLPWVKKVVVSKSFMPNVLQISLEERKVKSIWQLHEKFYPLDEEANVIRADFVPDRPILLIVGQGAPESVNELLRIVQKDKDIFERIKVANYISQRRWNLVLDDIREGITIKLPEENIEEAWDKLIKFNKTKGLLKRKLTIIDLRLPGKVIVKIRRTSSDEPIVLNNNKEKNM